MASRSTKALLAAGLTACVALTGCANPPSTAGKVNGTTITSSQVEKAVTGCGAAYAENFHEALDEAALRPQMASWLVLGEVARQLEEKSGIKATDSDIERSLSRYSDLPVLRADSRCGAIIDGLARYELVGVQLVGSNLWNEYFADADIEINPRYGAWNPQAQQVEYVPSGGLARVVRR